MEKRKKVCFTLDPKTPDLLGAIGISLGLPVYAGGTPPIGRVIDALALSFGDKGQAKKVRVSVEFDTAEEGLDATRELAAFLWDAVAEEDAKRRQRTEEGE